MLICTYEDRRRYSAGLQLLAHSLRHACPDQQLTVLCPASLVDVFRRELPRERLSLREWPHPDVSGWSVKPSVLLNMLDEGHNEVVWMDSDLIVTSEFRDRLDHSEAVVVTGEPRWVTQANRVGWAQGCGICVTPKFQNPINSCVIRVTPTHRRLLHEWQGRLASPEYHVEQALSLLDRRPHLRSDRGSGRP